MLPYKEKAARISHGNSRLGCKGETGNLISPPQSLYLSRKGFVSTEWQRKTDWKDTFWNIFDGRHCAARLSFTRKHLVPERGPHLFLPHSQTEPAALNLHPSITGHRHSFFAFLHVWPQVHPPIISSHFLYTLPGSSPKASQNSSGQGAEPRMFIFPFWWVPCHLILTVTCCACFITSVCGSIHCCD